ncbi:response regulator transcription factor [Cellulomonas sp. PhB143]|uniref:response regulator transcription factor n=1 Tax=Cellulomonas sp. PhB143 TaxID=2485186 RepID=UPI000F4706C8|nr:response regulator transcription factor [Cellulomonas sp. PhB143]ROS78643.1 LuxR family two component transcriptional regulator [Cellulomonas sp. PhB143]
MSAGAGAAAAAHGAPVRVLLVDDQALIRMGFRMILAAEDGIEVVGEAGDGAQALARARELRPDVVLMDVRMPGTDGIAATRAILAEDPRAKVLILTTFDLDEYAFAALRSGASGFLLKDARPADLVAAIRSVARGDAAVSARVTRRMLDLFADRLPDDPGDGSAGGAPSGTGTDHPRLAALTEREKEMFAALGEGLSNAEIAQRFTLSEATVKTHVGRVLGKLGLRDRVQAVVLAYETGVARPGS